ncbi:hypothetical protein RHIZ_02980 [Rhizobium skierniewicense]|uniref:hypothetical protein n=1 Tax=Rhizobium skierniewicense TaxID=984260 RepID=UPI001FACE943|nr:hypothetical protein [Rhizobium skierniewicense]MCI9864904.1 hypothetical protein [Rhizobium skierniewicense]
MSERHKKQMLVLLGWVLVAVLLPPILIGEPRVINDQCCGSAWRNIIYDFQTLITGGIAILAAFLTIRSAMQLDERQQQRHDQIVAFTVRPELRTLERALHPQLEEISAIIGRLWDTDFDPADPKKNSWKWFSHIAYSYRDAIRELREAIETEQFRDGLPYFDGRLSRAHSKFRTTLASFEEILADHRVADDQVDRGEEVWYEFTWPENKEDIVGSAMKFVADAKAFEAELLRAKAEYQQMLSRYNH